jgi:hypothetical protein
MMKNNDKLVLVLENSGSNLTRENGKDEYVLEGIFAQFGVENNNNRIYEEKEYLPHLDYLKKKINENRLLGELDHPDKFDISLSKVSHLIEDVKYDSKKRQIIGKIRLLDTPSGQIAKNLVDTGVPISISSRAAGVVGENKKVQIKRIFTYDLVADPGFENAQMKKINESLGYNDSENLAIYDMTEQFPEFLSTLENEDIYKTETEKTKTQEMSNKEYVSIDEMNKYSLIIKEEIEKMNKKLEEISSMAAGENKISKLAEEVENIKKYSNYLAEKTDGVIRYAEHVAEKADNGIQYSETIAEKLDQGISYIEHVAEKADQGISYAEHIAEKTDQSLRYSNYLAEKLNNGLNFANYLAEKLNQTVGYAEHIAEHADNAIRYTEYLSENATSKADFQSLTEYTEYMFENMNSSGVKGKDVSEDTNNNGVLSNALSEKKSISERYASLDTKIEAVLESIQKQKVESSSEDSKYPFLKFLGESKRNEFSTLNETEKEKVTRALNVSPAYTAEGITKVWESALTAVEVNESWLTNMPVEYISVWESASADVKDKIIRQAKLYNLTSEYQIKNFWQTRGLDKVNENADVELNESKRADLNRETVDKLGYSSDYVKMIAEQMNRYNR